MSKNNTDVPIHDPDRGFRVWKMDEIYQGPGEGRYVPNVDDMVWSWTTGMWRVIAVDPTTGLSEMERHDIPEKGEGVSDEDQLLGPDLTGQAESFRVYLDTSVTPHTLAVDGRLLVYGTTAKSIKIFQGTQIDDDSNVISAFYDQGGTFLGENIPLELAKIPDGDNRAIKTPMVGYTLKELSDGEVVTAVVYDDAANAISISKLLVKNTAFIRTTDASRKYVTGIHLESPFMSDAEDRLLQFPVNMPVKGLPLTGVVTYSDGSNSRMPVNTGRFNLYGLDHFIATISGQRVPLVLSYRLSENEYCYGAAQGQEKHISEKYWATTTDFERSYSIKIYAFPNWVDDIEGYKLEFFLYNLNRQEVHDVTSLAELTSTSAGFDPLKYGTRQRLAYAVDMNKVDRTYPPYRHVQTVEVTLLSDAVEDQVPWLVGFEPNQDPMFGHGPRAEISFLDTDNWKLRLDKGYGSKEEWLRETFYKTNPLYNPNLEERAPAPNYFAVVFNRRRYEFHIDEWNKEHTVVNDVKNGQNIYIEFFHRTFENDLQLGIAAFPVIEKEFVSQ